MHKSWRRIALWLLGTGLPWVVGCTHQNPVDPSVEKLRADIAKIEADRDRLDQRVEALEAVEQRRREGAEPPARKAPTETARQLPVVRVGEADARAAAPAPSEAPDIDRGSSEDAAASSSQAKRDYDGALALARSKQYDKALQALTAFLVRYPDHAHTENAMYWRGECFYATGAFTRAADQFEGQIARFPYGNKAADARLLLGLSREKLGGKQQASKTADAAQQVRRP